MPPDIPSLETAGHKGVSKGHITASQNKDIRSLSKHTSSRSRAVLWLCQNKGCSTGLNTSNTIAAVISIDNQLGYSITETRQGLLHLCK